MLGVGPSRFIQVTERAVCWKRYCPNLNTHNPALKTTPPNWSLFWSVFVLTPICQACIIGISEVDGVNTDMRKTEAKELAQDMILQMAAVAYYKVEQHDLSEEDQQLVYSALRQQNRRIARLFGYDEQPFTG